MGHDSEDPMNQQSTYKHTGRARNPVTCTGYSIASASGFH